MVVDGIGTREGEQWTDGARERERELGFELAVRIGVFCGVGDGPDLSGRRARAAHIRPIFVLDIRGAGQPGRLRPI